MLPYTWRLLVYTRLLILISRYLSTSSLSLSLFLFLSLSVCLFQSSAQRRMAMRTSVRRGHSVSLSSPPPPPTAMDPRLVSPTSLDGVMNDNEKEEEEKEDYALLQQQQQQRDSRPPLSKYPLGTKVRKVSWEAYVPWNGFWEKGFFACCCCCCGCQSNVFFPVVAFEIVIVYKHQSQMTSSYFN